MHAEDLAIHYSGDGEAIEAVGECRGREGGRDGRKEGRKEGGRKRRGNGLTHLPKLDVIAALALIIKAVDPID